MSSVLKSVLGSLVSVESTIQYNTILFKVESMRSGCPVSRARGSCLKCSTSALLELLELYFR